MKTNAINHIIAPMVAGLLLAASPATAADMCGPNAYTDSVEYKNGKEIIICSCAPGFSRLESDCERDVPVILLDYASLFIPDGQTGTVTAFIEHNGKRVDVPTDRIFYANAILTGPRSYMAAYLAQDKRLQIAADTQLHLGKAGPDTTLNIARLNGIIRLGGARTQTQRDAAALRYERARAYLRKSQPEHIRIRVPNGTIDAPSGDLLIASGENGDVTVHVLDGTVTIADAQAQNNVKLEAGDIGILRKGVAPKLLRKNQQAAITKLWQDHAPAQ